jgi:hypothetical protein
LDPIDKADGGEWQAEARILFERLDADSSGYVDENELSAVVGEAMAEEVMHEGDSNHNGLLSFDEWLGLLGRVPVTQRDQVLGTIGSVLASLESGRL